MLQLWRLVLVCGLLTGASASLLGPLRNVFDPEKLLLDEGLDNVENLLGFTGKTLRAGLQNILDPKILQEVKETVKNIGNLVGDGVSNLLTPEAKALGLKLKNPQLLDIKLELSPGSDGLNLRAPIKTDISLNLPIIGTLGNLKASLDILSVVKIEPDAQTGKLKLVKGQCATDPLSIQVTLPDRYEDSINEKLKDKTNLVKNTVSLMVQNGVCPLLGLFIDTLSVDVVQDAIGKLQQGIGVKLGR